MNSSQRLFAIRITRKLNDCLRAFACGLARQRHVKLLHVRRVESLAQSHPGRCRSRGEPIFWLWLTFEHTTRADPFRRWPALLPIGIVFGDAQGSDRRMTARQRIADTQPAYRCLREMTVHQMVERLFRVANTFFPIRL